MGGRSLRIGPANAKTVLDAGWQLAATPPGAAASPEELGPLTWLDVGRLRPRGPPGTAASALREAGQWSLDAADVSFDARDWWWRVEVPASDALPGSAAREATLSLDGLATLAQVWWNGELVLSSANMFLAHSVPVTLRDSNTLVICCRSLEQALAARRPRPRWRTPMVSHQQLRWMRTTLLGRTPGWSPPAAPVGPWRPVSIAPVGAGALAEVELHPSLVDAAGRLVISLTPSFPDGSAPARVTVRVRRRGESGAGHLATLVPAAAGRLSVTVDLPEVDLWWPHTHGKPALYSVDAFVEIGGEVFELQLGNVGFRTLKVHDADGGFALEINGTRVFCRGACWTPLDVVTLDADRAALEGAIELVAAAGMNMLRVGGTMAYESDDFYDLCDERGILVWQDLMFANMDYPDDEAFVDGVREEVGQFLRRLHARPAVAVVCGSSEGEQQAAMWGASRDRWTPRLFHEVIPAIVGEVLPSAFYWPSSAHGGAFPHQPSAGTVSYYGVGAYLYPLEDARRSGVRFATECLAFANIPEDGGLPGGESAVRVHQPLWKQRTPRDLGAGWDFDDVRDFYLAKLFRVDPLQVRYADHQRYLDLGRATSGEVMGAVMGEWRRSGSSCGGAIVWFLRDLWPGAGWGVVDSRGVPKPAWWYLRRTLAPVAVHITDEGGNGLVAHVFNDNASGLEGTLRVELFRDGEVRTGEGRVAVAVPARGSVEVPLAAAFEGFLDLSRAYRFGPPVADVVVVTLDCDGVATPPAFHFPSGLPNTVEHDLGLQASARAVPDGGVEVLVSSRRFAQSVRVDVPGFQADDQWFHVAPGGTRCIRLRATGEWREPAGVVAALNGRAQPRLRLVERPPDDGGARG